MPFYNTAEDFLHEAIRSVFAQQYLNWELILIDDGSTGPISETAVKYSYEYPDKVRFYEQPNNENKGHSAARNLGIRHAMGEYIAFLDADDIWMPDKLEKGVAILQAHPSVGMIYANTLYWYSWTNMPEDIKRDFIPALGIQPDTIVQPPNLLPLFIRGTAAVPSMNTVIIRHDVIERHGGFDERFRSLYGDQHYYAKISLFERVYVSGDCVDQYRQHSTSTTGKANKLNIETQARRFFLQWLEEYLKQKVRTDKNVLLELRRELWRISLPAWFPKNIRLQKTIRWAKKWLLKSEERLLPSPLRTRIWLRNSNNESLVIQQKEVG